jgi:hypothetical protein
MALAITSGHDGVLYLDDAILDETNFEHLASSPMIRAR